MTDEKPHKQITEPMQKHQRKGMRKIVLTILALVVLFIQPILAQEVAKNLTVTVDTFVGEEGNKELKGNLIIKENEGMDKKINISFTNLIDEVNSSQVLDNRRINVTSAYLNKDQFKSIVVIKRYSVWVGEMSIDTDGIKSGTYSGKAILEGTNFTPLDVDLSVKLTKPPLLPKWAVLSLAGFSILFGVFIITVLKNSPLGPFFAFASVVGGNILLYTSPLYDSVTNAALTTAFFVPLAAYIIDFLKERRDARLVLEKSVAEVRKTAFENAIDFLSGLASELATHKATFSCKHGVGANPLVDAVWKEGNKKAGLVSDLPGFRLARYYQYIDDFNKYLNARNTRPNSLKDPKTFDDFCNHFDQLNKAYDELENILYLNLYYTIGSLQYKLRSFKDMEVPFRMPKQLANDLANLLKIPVEKIEKNKIYKEKVAIDLMFKIERDFVTAYSELQKKFEEISKFKL